MEKINKYRLNDIDECIICQSHKIRTIIPDVYDNVVGMVPYSGDIKQCVDCNHVFLSPVPEEFDLHLAYEGYYTQCKKEISLNKKEKNKFKKFEKYYKYKYLDEFSFKGFMIHITSLFIPFSKFFLLRAVRYLIKPNPNFNNKLLDVGCGNGEFLLRANNCGYNTFGIDFDPATIVIAKSFGLNAAHCKIDDLPESDLYDVITLSHVIEHVPDPVALLSEIFKRLKPGGYFYLATPNFNSAGRNIFYKNWRGLDVPRHLNYFDNKSLIKILNEVGFVKIYDVYDFPQSVGILLSSFRLLNNNNLSIFFKKFICALKHKFFLKQKLDVISIKCYKSK